MEFFHRFNQKRWRRFNSEKVCAITYARIQGKDSLVSRFQNSSLMDKDEECRPLIFFSDGPRQGLSEQFPTREQFNTSGVGWHQVAGRGPPTLPRGQYHPSRAPTGPWGH